MKTKHLLLILMSLGLLSSGFGRQPERVNLDAVVEVIVRRIPGEINYPTATDAALFEKRFQSEVRYRMPGVSVVAAQIVETFNKISWSKSEAGMPDLRWSVEIRSSNESSAVKIYLPEKGDVLVCDGVAYDDAKALSSLLSRHLANALK